MTGTLTRRTAIPDTRKTRAIIIAAGQGTRLRPYTDDRPKCMVEIAGRPMLHHQMRALRAHGISEFVIIRGYLGDRIVPDAPEGVRFVDNTDFKNNNILMSLFTAGPNLVGDCVVGYADIVYHPDVVRAVLSSPAPGALIVDRQWQTAYEGRTDHPVTEAELCRLNRSLPGLVEEVGKQVGPGGAYGEFIGLARFRAPLVARLWAHYSAALYRGVDAPLGNAPSLRKAYLTDLVNEAIADGEYFAAVPIDGRWREIDTVQDLERARAIVNW
jgi:choline kinase